MTQNKQYTEQHNNLGIVLAVPRLGELYPGICRTTEEKVRKNLSQDHNTISPPEDEHSTARNMSSIII